MKILSLNVGLPREVAWQNKIVTTGIFKEPVKGPVMLRRLTLDGDGQAGNLLPDPWTGGRHSGGCDRIVRANRGRGRVASGDIVTLE